MNLNKIIRTDEGKFKQLLNGSSINGHSYSDDNSYFVEHDFSKYLSISPDGTVKTDKWGELKFNDNIYINKDLTVDKLYFSEDIHIGSRKWDSKIEVKDEGGIDILAKSGDIQIKIGGQGIQYTGGANTKKFEVDNMICLSPGGTSNYIIGNSTLYIKADNAGIIDFDTTDAGIRYKAANWTEEFKQLYINSDKGVEINGNGGAVYIYAGTSENPQKLEVGSRGTSYIQFNKDGTSRYYGSPTFKGTTLFEKDSTFNKNVIIKNSLLVGNPIGENNIYGGIKLIDSVVLNEDKTLQSYTSKISHLTTNNELSDLAYWNHSTQKWVIPDYVSKTEDILLEPVHTKLSTSWLESFAASGQIANAIWKLSGENGLLNNIGVGSYLIQILHSTDADGGVYTGYFSYTTGQGTDEEIILHRAGNDLHKNKSQGGRIYAKIKYIQSIGTCLLLSASKEESDCTELTIKMKKLL